MQMNYEKLQNMNVDPVIVQRIQSNPTMANEQGPGFMSEYGGADNYVEFAKMPVEQRLVLAAQMDGYTLPSEIAIVTGLKESTVNSTLSRLAKDGVIAPIDAEPLG